MPAGRPRARDDLVQREVDGEVLLYDPGTDQVALLNVSAAMVLDLCDGSRTVAEVTRDFREVFDLAEEVAGRDVQTALAELQESGLLEPQAGVQAG